MEIDTDNTRQRMRSVRAMRNTGVLLGIALTIGLCALVLLDRQARLDAAARQSMALATGVDRLLHYEMRNIQRAMQGIAARQAADAALPPDEASARIEDWIRGVVRRHDELDQIVRFDANAAAKSDVDARVARWVATLAHTDASLVAGPLRPLSKGWLLPLAVPTRDGGWIVAMFRTREIERMVDALDIGRDGNATIYTQAGVIVARLGRTGMHVGRAVDLPADVRHDGAVFSGHLVSKLDGIDRAVTFSNTRDYPFVVSAGIGLHEALAQWRIHAASALVLALLYWLVCGLVLRRAQRDERARDGLAAEVVAHADWLQQAQLASGTGVWRLYPEQGQVRATGEMVALYGLDRGGGQVPVEVFLDRIHDDDRARVQDELTASLADRRPFVQEYRVRLDDGTTRWLKVRGAAVSEGDSPVMTGTVTDITERRDAQQRMQRAEQQFRHLFERNPLPAWVYALDDLRFLAVNEAAIETYGYSRDALSHMTVDDLIAPEDQAAGCEALRSEVGGDAQDRLWMLMTRDARHIEVRVHARTIELGGRPARLVLAEDVGARMSYERDLAWRANHDQTTGLLTLAALAEQLDARSPAGDAAFAIAYVQLRDLELIAPTLGRRAGEDILCAAAMRIAQVAERYGACGYMPSDTFVVAAFDPGALDAMVAALLEVIGTPVEARCGTFPLQAWIGLASGPCETPGAEQLIGHAALASLQARRDNQQVVRYSAAMAEQASDRLAMVRRLRQAHERGEFELHFQPIHRLHDGGSLAAIEALLRWRQPDGSYLPPAQFIPLCEASGLIVPIGGWVLEEAARTHARLVEAGHGDVAIAVNVSAVQFEAGMRAETIGQLVQRHALPPRALHLELTESVLLQHPEDARLLMGALRDAGLCLSIDDFGTGFSNMAYLRELPLDHLKIDRAFVRDITRDPRSAAICRALIALGHGLGLALIAEGVEDAGQLEWLRAHGCDQAQGYYLGHPMPIDALLAAQAHRTWHLR